MRTYPKNAMLANELNLWILNGTNGITFCVSGDVA